MTEEEAKKRWCPMALYPSNATTTGAQPHRADCIGSACMMWRWGQDGLKSVVTEEQGMQTHVTHIFVKGTHKKHGYCGLAGVPGIL